MEPHRTGRRVYYRLSLAGESLLKIFEETGQKLTKQIVSGIKRILMKKVNIENLTKSEYFFLGKRNSESRRADSNR